MNILKLSNQSDPKDWTKSKTPDLKGDLITVQV